MPTSEAQKKAAIKYLKKQEQIRFWVTPEKKKEIEETAKSRGKSMRAYILGLIDADSEKTTP